MDPSGGRENRGGGGQWRPDEGGGGGVGRGGWHKQSEVMANTYKGRPGSGRRN